MVSVALTPHLDMMKHKTNAKEACGKVVIASSCGTGDPGSNPVRVLGF
jgi:hypothetical protein